MQRVLILGCSGAGKTTLANELSRRTGLPVIHLDTEFFQPGWTEPDKQEWAAKVEELAARTQWIMDGNFLDAAAPRLARADTVIFLDFPRWRCVWGIVRRTARYLGRTRPDIPAGCVESIDVAFYRYVWTWRTKYRARVLALLNEFGGDTVILKLPKDAYQFLEKISPTTS